MKSLKLTLLLAVIFATLSSCTKQDLNEDDLLNAPAPIVEIDRGGNITER